MRMGFANENLVAIAELGGDVVGHRHGHVPGHVQEGVYCVESLVPDNDDDDVGGNADSYTHLTQPTKRIV